MIKKIKVLHKPTSEVHHHSQFGYVFFFTSFCSCSHSFIHSLIHLLAWSMLIEELLCILDSRKTVVSKTQNCSHGALYILSVFFQ